ncbi:hypothetical protein HY029_05450 [Candidatus Gottesmanbacteria bacterium]|nr:hypothetical protein [Candidatus Gottesmanbacteria bacterium]
MANVLESQINERNMCSGCAYLVENNSLSQCGNPALGSDQKTRNQGRADRASQGCCNDAYLWPSGPVSMVRKEGTIFWEVKERLSTSC